VDGRPVLRGLTVGDPPEAWERAGFAVDGDRLAIDGVTIRLLGDGGPRGIVSWELDHPNPRAADGLVHDDVGAPARPADHPNGAALVDHLVARTPDVERTTDALAELGVTVRRTVDGVRGDADRRYRFFLLGTCVLELIGPVVPTGRDPARFVGLALATYDLDATAAWLGDACDDPHDAVQPGRRIATVRHRELGISVPLAFLTPRP
jgi:hypothetical protein